MATLSETDYTRISTEASEHFVDSFYTALNGSRNQISSFYIPTTAISPDRSLPHISFNGEILQHADILQERFEKQMPWTHFEPQSVDVHVLNPTLTPVTSNASKREQERNISLTVQVSGYVRLAERKEGPMRGFSDSFVLVPNNKEEAGGRGTGRQDHGRRFLIQSQNFRFVV